MEIVILLVSLLAIVWGANNLVNGAVQIAQRYNISDFVIGAAIVGIGTSFPELVVSVYGAIQGKVDVAIGNVVGSNIFNVLGILGLTAVLCPIVVDKANMRFELPFCIGVSILAILLAFNYFNGSPVMISRIDGLMLLAFFAFYMWLSFRKNDQEIPVQEQPSCTATKRSPIFSALQVLVGLSVLVAGCHYFVDTAALLATQLGVNEAFISITLIACGTSMPEMAASLAAAFKKNTQLALGNIVGSNIFNITFILGISSLVSPLSGGGIVMTDYLVMLAAAIIPLILGFRGKISRVSGCLMFGGLVLYLAFLLQQQMAS